MILSPKEEAFVHYFVQGVGDKEAVKLAGYDVTTESSAQVKASQLKARPKIRERIRQLADLSDAVAKSTEVLEFWSGVMNDPEVDMKERLKASEYLAKRYGLFQPIKHEVKVESTMNPKDTLAGLLGLLDDTEETPEPLRLFAESPDSVLPS